MNTQQTQKSAVVIRLPIMKAAMVLQNRATAAKQSHGKARYDEGFTYGWMWGALITATIYTVGILVAAAIWST